MIIADTNEFHPLVNGVSYRDSKEQDGTNHPVVIMRATYGTERVDLQYVTSLFQARKAGLLVGHYGYLVATMDAAAQGLFFGKTLHANGGLKLGDSIWCDAEEGDGNQSERVETFLSAAHSVLHDDLTDEGVYSGAAFWASHLATLPDKNIIRWVAAYGQSDPKMHGEELWQFTDNRVMAGVSGPCDASIYNGTLDDFTRMVYPLSYFGPYRHVITDPTKSSIDDVAKYRDTTVNEIIKVTRVKVSPRNGAVLSSYLSLRESLHAAGQPSPVLPVGFVYWTVNP